MQKLLIFPYNGNGLEASACLGKSMDLIGFVDDTPGKQGKTPHGHTVFGREAFSKYKEALVLAVPGSPASYLQRKEIIEGLGINPSRFASVIHPSAQVSEMARIGCNTLIMAGAVITSNAVIGNHTCILPNTVIHHDAEVGDYTLLGSNTVVAGSSRIGKNCYIGSGALLIGHIIIGDCTLVGMGAVVLNSLPAGAKAVGNPARII